VFCSSFFIWSHALWEFFTPPCIFSISLSKCFCICRHKLN
jgi:hypothetical protein